MDKPPKIIIDEELYPSTSPGSNILKSHDQHFPIRDFLWTTDHRK